MSKTYGKATPVGDGDRVTYTPQAAIIEVAARGGFSEHDILDVDPTSGPTGAPAVHQLATNPRPALRGQPLATNPAPLNGRQSLLDGIAGPVEDPARIVLRSVDDAIGALNAPPPMPQLWVVTGRWGVTGCTPKQKPVKSS